MYDLNNFAFAYSQPLASGLFKASPDDFKVEEHLGFELTGEGEHLFLHIEKSGLNTEELVKALARLLNKPSKQISYAGLKDRHALTTQWVSVHCPGEDIAQADELQGPGWRVLKSQRHLKKLKIGALQCNQFTLMVREISSPDDVERRLHHIKKNGVPNYFGQQRFGHQGQNLSKAEEMLLQGKRVKDRFLKGMYFSAARSFLFNRILSARVAHENWNKALVGDVMQLAGSKSIFPYHAFDETIPKRVSEQDLSPTSVLWGRGKELIAMEALNVQQQALQGFELWCERLEQGLERAYRANRLQVDDFSWQWQGNCLCLRFQLTPGAYATSVLRELIL